MVFWNTYPILNAIQTKFNTNIFKSQIFDKELGDLPMGSSEIIINKEQNTKYINDVCNFLKNNFGTPPKTPILDIPENILLDNKDHVIIVRDIDKNIIGCVRYHYLGIFVTNENEEIYCVDCFCVNKKWRGKGIGDYLLTRLHIYVNENNIPYSLFLKEGRNLSIVHTPIYTGLYVYRQLGHTVESENIKSLTVRQAYNLMDLFRELNFGMFIIRNIKSTNQIWKLYKKDTYKVLACFQDAYQRFEEDGKMKKIAWATAWIESPNVTDNIREEASKVLSDTMYPEFDYIWMNKEWIGNSDIWKIDGTFHWYSYQWTTCINIKKSYCILN
jgi:GNAT superfamily N-acetyltransferase